MTGDEKNRWVCKEHGVFTSGATSGWHCPLCNLAGVPYSEKGPQTTRMRKCWCEKCGYTIRTTAKWLATGVPLCPCNGETMKVEPPKEDGATED